MQVLEVRDIITKSNQMTAHATKEDGENLLLKSSFCIYGTINSRTPCIVEEEYVVWCGDVYHSGVNRRALSGGVEGRYKHATKRT